MIGFGIQKEQKNCSDLGLTTGDHISVKYKTKSKRFLKRLFGSSVIISNGSFVGISTLGENQPETFISLRRIVNETEPIILLIKLKNILEISYMKEKKNEKNSNTGNNDIGIITNS